jgi:hypothetical protein
MQNTAAICQRAMCATISQSQSIATLFFPSVTAEISTVGEKNLPPVNCMVGCFSSGGTDSHRLAQDSIHRRGQS